MRAQTRVASLIGVLVLVGASGAAARGTEVSFQGPDRSPDGLVLSDFSVSTSGTPPRLGDVAKVRFKLTNASGQPLQLGAKGVFLTVRWNRPGAQVQRERALHKEKATLQPNEVVSVWDIVKLEHEGAWSFWPAYEIDRRSSPERWHELKLEVAETLRAVRRLGYCSDVEKLPKGIALLGFSVFGPAPTRVGDDLTIEYHLQNRARRPIVFGPGGVYVVTALNNKERNFGHQLAGGTLTPDRPDRVLAVEASTRVDAPGEWRFGPAFDPGDRPSPSDWCQVTVVVTP